MDAYISTALKDRKKQDVRKSALDDDNNDESIDNYDKKDESELANIEMELEEFDENDPDMDPLEWSTRKLVSIPKAYYWQTENYDVPMNVKIWHRTVSTLGSIAKGAESIGGVFAGMVGLDGSDVDYVTSTMSPEEMTKSKRDLFKRIDSRRALSLRHLGERPPSQRKGDLELSSPLNAIQETESSDANNEKDKSDIDSL